MRSTRSKAITTEKRKRFAVTEIELIIFNRVCPDKTLLVYIHSVYVKSEKCCK